MRTLHPIVNSAVALLLLSSALQAAEAPAEKMAATLTPPKVAMEAPAQEQQYAQPTLAPETQSVHVQVGRSIILNTQARLRRIVVSNPNVLDTATISPTQVVVTAKAPGSSSLVLWDEGANARIVDVYADVDISGLSDGIKSAYPHDPVQIEAEQGKVVISGRVRSKAVADDIVRIAGVYSKEVVDSLVIEAPHEKQIMLKVRFAEIDRTKLQQFAVNLLSTGAANTPGTTTTGQFGPPNLGNGALLTGAIGAPAQGFTTSLSESNLLNVFLFRPDLNLGAAIADLEQKNVLQILSEPNLMARSGQPAKFLAGGEFPFPVVQGGVGSSVAVTIQFKPYGVKLDFTGTIDGDVIRLKVAPEVSTLDFTNAVQISGFEIPAISTRRAETEVDLRNGQSFGIAGLLDKRTTAILSKMPGIGDIPILGQLFRSKSINQTNSELLVLVTPVIVDPLSEGAVAAPATPAMSVPNMENKKFDRMMNGKPATTETTNENN